LTSRIFVLKYSNPSSSPLTVAERNFIHEQKFSYQIAAFELNGKDLIYFAGWKNHVSIYPIPSGTEAFNKEAAKYADD